MKIADFDRFRFFRDADHNVVSLDAQASRELLIPVYDCTTLRIARLHLFEGTASDEACKEAFETEMELLSSDTHRCISKPTAHGEDDNELYYVNALLDGEPLRDYISRVGAMSPPAAAQLMLPLIDLIQTSSVELPLSVLRLNTRSLQVVRDSQSNLPGLVVTEFSAWTRPEAPSVEHGPEYFLAQIYLCLLGGIPERDFTTENLPRQTEGMDESLISALTQTFDAAPGDAEDDFFDQLHAQAELYTDEKKPIQLPQSTIQKYFLREIERLPDPEAYAPLSDEVQQRPALSYGVESHHDDLPSTIHYVPGEASIPREAWLLQHWQAIDRAPQNLPNQLAVYEHSAHPALAVVEEERPSGVHLRRLIHETGTLDTQHSLKLANRLQTSLEGLESRTGAPPVWWVPVQNIYLNFGSTDIDIYRKAVADEGPDFWSRLPVRMRLHQTMQNLLEGFDLPESIRSLAIEQDNKNPHIRRAAVILPALGLCLTGKKFHWDQPFSLEGVQSDLGKTIDRLRLHVVESPDKLPHDFLTDFDQFTSIDEATTEEPNDAKESAEKTPATQPEPKQEEPAPAPEAPQTNPIAAAAAATQSAPKQKAEAEPNQPAEPETAKVEEKTTDEKANEETAQEETTSSKDKTKQNTEEKDPNYSFLDPRHEGRDFQDTTGDDEVTADEKTITEESKAYQPGITHNPIAVGVAKDAHAEKKAERQAAKEKIEQEKEAKRQQVRERIGLDRPRKPKPVEIRPKHSKLPWVLVTFSAIIVACGVGYHFINNAKHAGIYEMDAGFELPETRYDTIAPLVNPFTNSIESNRPSKPVSRPKDANAVDTASSLALAKERLLQDRYSEAVDLTLWAIQLDDSSADAAALLESSLVKWIESGKAAPSRTDDTSAASVLSEYYIADQSNQTSQGLYLLMKSVGKGNVEAMRTLGLLFGQGRLVPKSSLLAEKWLKSAADRGDLDAHFYYGESATFGTLVETGPAGMDYIEKAAAAGHARSLCLRGYCRLTGKYTDKNVQSGYEDVAAAADKGSLIALHQMGLCRGNGLGTTTNAKAAASAFKMAAELGHVPAMYRYAQCRIYGVGTERVYADGVASMKQAAEAGVEEAKIWCREQGVEFDG